MMRFPGTRPSRPYVSGAIRASRVSARPPALRPRRELLVSKTLKHNAASRREKMIFSSPVAAARKSRKPCRKD